MKFMKVRELKEILNATAEHDELDIYVSPLTEIEDPESTGSNPAKRLVPELFERYRILKIMQFSPHLEGAPEAAMIFGYDDSVNCIETELSQEESEEFVN